MTFIVQFTSILFLRYVLSAVETRVHKSLIENNLQTLFPSLKRIIRLGPQTSKTSESTASLSLAEQVRRTAGTDYRNSNLGKIPLPDFFFCPLNLNNAVRHTANHLLHLLHSLAFIYLFIILFSMPCCIQTCYRYGAVVQLQVCVRIKRSE